MMTSTARLGQAPGPDRQEGLAGVLHRAGGRGLEPRLLRRRGLERQRVDRAGQLVLQQLVDEALAGDAALAGEGGRDDFQVEMALAVLVARARHAGMARMAG